MKIGLMHGAIPDPNASIAGFVALAQDAEARGFSSLMLAHVRGHDAIMAMAVAGAATTKIEVGTAVTPIQPRHPVALAQQALTAAAMTNGRFTLGVGLSHKVVIEDAFGLSYAKPAATMEEYLEVLTAFLRGEAVHHEGEQHRVHFALDVPDAVLPVSVVVAALGPKMLAIAGRYGDGTALWMTGAATIGDHIVPGISRAADAVGKPAPRIIAGFPIVLTNDADAARQKIGETLAVYGQLPSYRAMLDREGISGPADLALVGGENVLDAALQKLKDAGVTDLVAVPMDTDPDARNRTLDYLQSKV